MRRLRSVVRAVVATGVVLVSLTVPASRADEANQACTNGEDVTVVVDFGSIGGGVNVRCAPQPIKSGFDALERGNIAYDHYQGFVCRIAGKPENESCNRYPPSDAYWVYWIAEPGGEWKYSKYGAGSRKPPKGSLDGWAFHLRSDADPEPKAPRYPVPAAPSTPSPTTTTAGGGQVTTPPPAPASPGATNASTVTTRRGAAPSVTTTAAADASATTTTDPNEYEPTEDPSQALARTTTSVKLGDVDLSVDGSDGGTSVGFILSAVSVVGVGAIAFAFLRARGR